MSSPTPADVSRVIADALGLDVSEVGADASMESLASWDSLQHLSVVMALEAEFGCHLGPEEVTRLTSVARIAEHLGAR